MSTAALYCRNCGKQLTGDEQAPGNVYCAECKPAAEASAAAASAASAAIPGTAAGTSAYTSPPPPPPYPPPAVGAPSPGLAFLLGLIPGVGAIYNGQYAKGLIHVFVLGFLATIADGPGSRDTGPLFPMLIMAWIAYMAFEAYHTARNRLLGQPVDEFSSLFRRHAGSLAAPVILIVIGTLFLLHNLDLLFLRDVARFWPVLLIAAGIFLLYQRLSGDDPEGPRPVDQ
jgi:hypothetical protein